MIAVENSENMFDYYFFFLLRCHMTEFATAQN